MKRPVAQDVLALIAFLRCAMRVDRLTPFISLRLNSPARIAVLMLLRNRTPIPIFF